MKKSVLIFFVFILIIGFGADYLFDRAPIFTGFSAKMVASQMFLADRTQADIENNELHSFFLSLSKNVVDEKAKTVEGSFMGRAKQKAVYREGLGCTLIADGDETAVRKQKVVQKILPERPDTIAWPTGDVLPDGNSVKVDISKLKDAIGNAFNHGNTRAVVVCYDTSFFIEKYADGFSNKTRLLGWSMSKSVTGTMIGVLVKQGRLEIDAPAPVKEWQDDNRKNITVNNLMHMTSGLEWVEDYTDISDATIMLYQKGDMGAFALNKPAVYPPDSVWYYSSGTSNILSLIIRRQFKNDQDYWKFPRETIFNKIGMRSAVFETDASGTFVGSSYIFANARDWARYGLLYLRNGVWNGEQILPEGWTEYTAMPAPGSKDEYGAQFWLQPKELPDAPEDAYFCDGYHGQRVYIIPSKKLVIVRFGLNKHGEFDYNGFVKSIIDAFD
jgi:hypothetical protein